MSGFDQLVFTWQSFYLLMGTAAATLIGLLFVAMSIHTEVFHRRVASGLELFAALTFNCYFYVLLVAILFVVPGLTPPILGVPLASLGTLGLANAVLQQRRARKYSLDNGTRSLASRFVVPIASMAGLALMGIGIAMRVEASFYGLVVVLVLLLGSASQNAWALLIGSETSTQGKSRSKE